MHRAGSVALITGAGQGLGKAFSRAILERGGKVGLHHFLCMEGRFGLLILILETRKSLPAVEVKRGV